MPKGSIRRIHWFDRVLHLPTHFAYWRQTPPHRQPVIIEVVGEQRGGGGVHMGGLPVFEFGQTGSKSTNHER